MTAKTKAVILMMLLPLLIMQMVTKSTTTSALQEEPWQEYIDEDYKFTVEFPNQNWDVMTRWNVSEAQPQAIMKRVSFIGNNRVELIIDIWKQPSEDIVSWVNHLNHRIQPDLKATINGTISGFPTIVYIDENDQAPNVLTTAFSDGNAFYMIQYIMSDGGTAMNTYLHLLSSFKSTATNNTKIAGEFNFPLDLQEKAMDNVAYSGADSCCGVSDPGNPFPCNNGNCTWWVYYIKSYVPFSGDAWEWGHKVDSGLYPGWYLSATPAIGSIAWWDRNTCWTSAGHVADVYGKTSNNSKINVSEMTWQGTPCTEEPRYRQISIPSCQEPTGFIRQ